MAIKSAKCFLMALLTLRVACTGFRCAPPSGSWMIPSMMSSWIRSSAIGFLSVFTGAIFYFMIFGGIVLWAADFSGPIGNDSFLSAKGLPGIILKNIYNLLFSLFGTYTNKICSIILFLIPPLSLWQFLKEHYSFN